MRSSQKFIVATISLSMFTDTFLYGMIIPLMPTALITRTSIPFEDREFFNSILLVSEAAASVVCAPVFGYLLDRSETRRKLYILGLLLLLVSMALLTYAFSIACYIAARILQGAATAMVAVAGFSIVTDTIQKAHLGYMLGYIDVGLTLGFASGPLLGGLIYHAAGYYTVCGVAFGLIGIDLVLRLAVIEKKTAMYWLEPEENERMPEPVIPTPCLHYDAIQKSNESLKSKRGMFAFWTLLQQPRILITTWTFILQSLFNSALDSTLPIFVMDRFHWDTAGAGMIFLPMVATVLLQPFCGFLSDRLGARMVATTGFILIVPSLICLRFVEMNTMQDKTLLCVLLALFGTFNNGISPCLLVETQQVVDELEEETPGVFGDNGATAQAFSLQQMAQFTGMVIGPMIGGFIDHRYGWKMMNLCLGTLSAITAVLTLQLSGPEPNGDPEEDYQEQEPLLR
ncbi:hypothetical protein N7476_009663 [Penicillium atrosanguineum]|uniref:Major facilitator superfamily (MFS) profile domain-containing protein n=2 Tax=Penicillium atrosanguineum TaxID=1132637 RepID=A0A9W9U136_9EURO|nr:hypothetical protein N7476_009663 [Penicillium atrosanguineum]